MKWLEVLYKYNKFKERYRMHKQQITEALKKKYINKNQREELKKLNEEYRIKLRHPFAICERTQNIYEFYFKTSKEKHEGHENIKIEEKIYIGNEPVKIQFKELKEFYETFDISTQKQIKVKMNEEQQEEFLKRVKQENENLSENIKDITENYYIEDKIYEIAYINKMQESNEEELLEFEKELDLFFLKIREQQKLIEIDKNEKNWDE